MSQAIQNAAIALAHAIMAEIQMRSGANVGVVDNTPTPTPTPTPAVDPFGGLGGTPAPAAAPEVTPKMIQELIIPLLSNEAAKQRLSAAMQSMGISELPAARPDQLPELYAKFKAIAAEVNGAQPAAAAGGVSII